MFKSSKDASLPIAFLDLRFAGPADRGAAHASATGLRDRSALKQIELAAGDRPFDVSAGAVDVLTAVGEPRELLELVVVEAESFDQLGRDLLLDRAAVRNPADGNPLQSRLPLEHVTRTVDPIVVVVVEIAPLTSRAW